MFAQWVNCLKVHFSGLKPVVKGHDCIVRWCVSNAFFFLLPWLLLGLPDQVEQSIWKLESVLYLTLEKIMSSSLSIIFAVDCGRYPY